VRGARLGDGAHPIGRFDAVNRTAEGLGQRRCQPADAAAEIDDGQRPSRRQVRGEPRHPARRHRGRHAPPLGVGPVLVVVVVDPLERHRLFLSMLPLRSAGELRARSRLRGAQADDAIRQELDLEFRTGLHAQMREQRVAERHHPFRGNFMHGHAATLPHDYQDVLQFIRAGDHAGSAG